MDNKLINEQFEMTKNILSTLMDKDANEFAMWMRKKAQINFLNKFVDLLIFSGGVYWAELGINIGSEQNKLRPIVVLKSFKEASIVTILPLTSRREGDAYLYHIDLTTIKSTVLVEQIRTISKKRIIGPYRRGGKIIYLNRNDMISINECIKKLYRFKV